MKKKKVLKYSIVTITLLLVISISGMLIWTNNTYNPTSELLSLVPESDYIKDRDFYVFNAKTQSNGKGIVIYPGALVEPLSYGYIANELSKAGFLVAIPEVKLNLSITENNKASEFIANNKEIEDWYVAGHSMGGVSATYYAEDNQDVIDGVILLGSYPSKSTDLSDNSQEVISIYAENDGLTTLDNVENSKKNLPQDTIFVEIKGGNHAQFGMYGEQKGDNKAEISAKEQQDEIINIILENIK